MRTAGPLKVLVWTNLAPGNGVFHYRVQQPLAECQRRGLAEVTVTGQASWEDVRACDVLMIPALLMHRVPALVRYLGEDRPLIVVDNDDNNLTAQPDSPTWRSGAVTYDEFMTSYVPRNRAALRAADLVTVAVPHLAAVYGRTTRTPIEVLPNTIDEVLLGNQQPLRRPGEPLRVGWAGSGSHVKDWAVHAEALRCALGEADARLTLLGADVSSLIGHPATEVLAWTRSLDAYYEQLATWHVALAPLIEDEFNRAKSPLKALEAGALGIPIVASAAGPYRDYVRDGETGFLCRGDDDWVRALRELAHDEEMRRAMGRAARQVAGAHTTQEWAPRWVEAYRSAIERRAG